MKSSGITMASSPKDGSVAITYNELEASNAMRFIALYVDEDAPEYNGDLDGEKLPESILAAAIAFNKALQVLHFAPEMSIQWLIDNVPGVTDETVRCYAERALGMESAEDPVAIIRDRMKARRAAAGEFGKEVQLEHALDGADSNMVVNALHANFDGDDLVELAERLMDLAKLHPDFGINKSALPIG